MPVSFELLNKTHSVQNIKRNKKSQRKTFVYTKGKSDFNFDQMYQDLQPAVAQLVQQNRIKLNSMNAIRSKYLINKTHFKLVSFMKSKPSSNNKYFTSSTERFHKSNIYLKPDQLKQNHQHIFDFNKLQNILKTYQNHPRKSSPRFSGALAQKVIKLAERNTWVKPNTQRNISIQSRQQTQRSKNYFGWKTAKSQRRLKHMFS